MQGVTIPSQRRYVEYYSELLQSQRSYQPVKMLLHALRLEPPPPCINGGGLLEVFLNVLFLKYRLFSTRCNIYISCLCYDVSVVCPSICL